MLLKSLSATATAALLFTLPGLVIQPSSPAQAADRLVITQGSLSRGISVKAIKRYVQTGEATENLA